MSSFDGFEDDDERKTGEHFFNYRFLFSYVTIYSSEITEWNITEH